MPVARRHPSRGPFPPPLRQHPGPPTVPGGHTGDTGSRERILLATAQLWGENPAATPSVRAVAARAGLSTGSLRHHFPTQRALQEEVLTRIYGYLTPGDVIHDRAVPARDRLVDCLRQVLAGAGAGDEARRALGVVVERFVAPTPTDELREAYRGIEQEAQRRVRYWLGVLTDEGELAPGDDVRRARFLTTVLNGLSLERALPTSESILASEGDTLHAAVDWVFSTPALTGAAAGPRGDDGCGSGRRPAG